MPPRGQGYGTPLSDYIEAWRLKTDTSVNALAAAASKHLPPDQQLHTSWVRRLVRNESPAPELWRLRALAAAMGADLEELKRLAARQWLELEVDEFRREDEVIVISVPRGISEAERRRIRRMVEAALDED